ncbi:MAG: cyclopropane-fatty-acyl-phospholipid synthase family protein [Dehalococcoidia bacterium]
MIEWQSASDSDAAAVKSCCVTAYESEWVELLLGASWHPGGLELTMHAGAMLELAPNRTLLDVACGQGASAIALAREYGCSALGVDLSARNVEIARGDAERAGVADRVRFEVGDAEWLRVDDETFDAVLCECAFCTFPSKEAAAREFARALRPGGVVCVTDVTLDGRLPGDLDTLLGRVACIAEAQPAVAYATELAAAGLAVGTIERHDGAVRELLQQVRLRLLAAEVASALGKLALSRESLREAKSLLRSASGAVDDGTLGYALITARAGLPPREERF